MECLKMGAESFVDLQFGALETRREDVACLPVQLVIVACKFNFNF